MISLFLIGTEAQKHGHSHVICYARFQSNGKHHFNNDVCENFGEQTTHKRLPRERERDSFENQISTERMKIDFDCGCQPTSHLLAIYGCMYNIIMIIYINIYHYIFIYACSVYDGELIWSCQQYFIIITIVRSSNERHTSKHIWDIKHTHHIHVIEIHIIYIYLYIYCMYIWRNNWLYKG